MCSFLVAFQGLVRTVPPTCHTTLQNPYWAYQKASECLLPSGNLGEVFEASHVGC
jgi:hypothetical protein